MAVRVRLQLRRKGRGTVEAVALLNGGFETAEPFLLLPKALALKLFPDFPAGASGVRGETVGGMAALFLLSESVEVRARGGRGQGTIRSCRLLVSDIEREVLVSDSAIDALGISIESFGAGTWRFKGEKKLRSSEQPQYWT